RCGGSESVESGGGGVTARGGESGAARATRPEARAAGPRPRDLRAQAHPRHGAHPLERPRGQGGPYDPRPRPEARRVDGLGTGKRGAEALRREARRGERHPRRSAAGRQPTADRRGERGGGSGRSPTCGEAPDGGGGLAARARRGGGRAVRVKPPLPRLHAITDERIARRADLADVASALATAAGGDVALHARGRALTGLAHYELAIRLTAYP